MILTIFRKMFLVHYRLPPSLILTILRKMFLVHPASHWKMEPEGEASPRNHWKTQYRSEKPRKELRASGQEKPMVPEAGFLGGGKKATKGNPLVTPLGIL